MNSVVKNENTAIILGDYVRTKKHGHVGRVSIKDFVCKATPEWLAQQEVPPHPKMLDEHWYHILCVGGGSVYCNHSDLVKIEPIALNNSWEEFYFGSYIVKSTGV